MAHTFDQFVQLLIQVSTFVLQCVVQLTDTPIFALFGEMSVNSQMSVKFKNVEK